MKRGKKGQFYIIAAVIIASLILSLANVSNYVITREISKKGIQTFGDFNNEVLNAMDYCIKNKVSTESCILEISQIFSNYLKDNTLENFELTIFYGDINSDKIKSITYSRTSGGCVSTGNMCLPTSGQITEITKTNTVNPPDPITGIITVDVTINGIVYKAPVLEDNNFMSIMITQEGLNNYVLTNLND